MSKKQRSKLSAINWNETINKAIAREDWFAGFTNSISYFEYWGYWRLRKYCIEKSINISSKIKKEMQGIHVRNLILFLYLLKLINEETYARIDKVVVERNKLVHPTRKGLIYRDSKKKERATQLLEDAKICINELIEGIRR